MSLAAALRAAHDDLTAVEWQVDTLLESLFAGWRRRFPRAMGWRFTSPAQLDVYDVADPPQQTVEVLRRAGFDVVVLHVHKAVAFLTCTCSEAK